MYPWSPPRNAPVRPSRTHPEQGGRPEPPTGRGAGEVDADTAPPLRDRPAPSSAKKGPRSVGAESAHENIEGPFVRTRAVPARRPTRWRRGPVFLGRPGARPCVAHAHGPARATEVFRTAVLHGSRHTGVLRSRTHAPLGPGSALHQGSPPNPWPVRFLRSPPRASPTAMPRERPTRLPGPTSMRACSLSKAASKEWECRPRRSPAIGVPEVGSSR